MRSIKLYLLFGCALFTFPAVPTPGQDNQPLKPSDKETAVPTDQKQNVQNPGAAVTAENPYRNQTSEKYRIGFQDTIEIQVNRHPELSQVVNINRDGTILMPRLEKPIIAVCKTERELADTIATQYKSYLKNPFVNVRAVEQRSQPFAVLGAVQKPGSFYMNRKIRLLELLAFAGGPDVQNAGSKIQVARIGNVAGCSEGADVAETADDGVEFLGYNLNDVLKGEENPWMQPGDIVSVLMAEEAYVVGNVLKPVKIVLREPKTLTQALAEAGGTTSTAKTDKVYIQRQEPGSNTKSELSFNLKDIRDRKIPDPQLQGNDIVQVSNDKFKSISKGLLDILKSSAPSAIYRIP